MNTQKQIFLIVVLFFTIVAGCASYSFIEPIRAERQEDFFQSESIRRGALLYANNCRTCHGIQGQGGVGLPLNIDRFKNQDPLALEANRALLQRTLYCGRAGTQMPPWLNENGGSLSNTQIEHIINFITAPVTERNEDGTPAEPPNKGWEEALEFAHNLNHEATAIVAGDSLDTIAASHGVGPAELAASLGVDPGAMLDDGTEVPLPAPLDGRTFVVANDRGSTVEQVAADAHLGAAIIADLNGLDYDLDEDFGLTLRIDGQVVSGLFPGQTLALPAGVGYQVVAGDTLQSVADVHGITADELIELNDNVPDDPEAVLESRVTLLIPDGATFLATADMTIGSIAPLLATGPDDGSVHTDVEASDFAELNGLEEGATFTAQTPLELPDDTHYIVQDGDTLESVASLFSAEEADIAALNDFDDPGARLPEGIHLVLPDIEAYVVQGQSLEDVAGTLSGVSAASIAEANGLEPDSNVAVGSVLAYPEDAWGTQPPDTTTAGTVCLENALPESVYDTLPGVGEEEPFEPEPAETPAAEVTITSGANDWTVTADGVEMEPNRGAVTIATGTTVTYQNGVGVHTITQNGEKQGEDLTGTETRTFTFDEEGDFDITCDYHPAMLAVIFVRSF